MRSPAHMEQIQIEITNHCWKRCSNCTRMIGHYKKESLYFMDFDFFQNAVDSLIYFPGRIGIMGGEPTLHPQFEEMTCYLRDRIPQKERRGLWSSLPDQYFKHVKLIKDTYGYEISNDHVTPSNHQPIMVALKDVVKNDEQRRSLINQCWVQNCWSASINPKGAFFCEIAAAFSILYDGPQGLPVEPGWWKIQPQDPAFQQQIEDYCHNCGASIPLPARKTDEIIDDISESNLSRITAFSPKVKRQEYTLFVPGISPFGYNITPGSFASADDRISHENQENFLALIGRRVTHASDGSIRNP